MKPVGTGQWGRKLAVQQGIQARVHKYGFYAPMEDFNLDIRRYVTDRIGGHVDATE